MHFTIEKVGTHEGKDVHQIVVRNIAALGASQLEGSVALTLLTYGATIRELITTDKNGCPVDVVLGYDTWEGYLSKSNAAHGCIVGRFANRIANGKFTLDGVTYQLPLNESNRQTLHGGFKGFDKKVWDYETFEDDKHCKVIMSLHSPSGDEGFPSAIDVKVIYTVCKHQPKWKYDVEARISPTEEEKAATPINLTNHAYFNLNGHDQGTINNHEFMIAADKFVRVDSNNIPTGELVDVRNTPFEFLTFKKVGARIDDFSDPDIKQGKGYDHALVLRGRDQRHVGFFKGDLSGICMLVSTTQPGGQLYTGNWLEKTNKEYKKGACYGPRSGFAFETANYADAMNQPSFPNCILRKGEVYSHKTEYEFVIF